MQIAKVTGTVVSTVKDLRLTASKLLLLSMLDRSGAETGATPVVAVDLVGAGVGEVVLVVRGTPASRAVSDVGVPVDAAIVGIVDSISDEAPGGR